MRILHTSDWHLGRSIEKVSLQDSQVAFIDELVDIVKAEKVTAVLVSGDIYDRAIPNPDVINMLEESLMKLLDHTQVIITSGNHDSPQRLGFGGRLMEKSGLHIRTRMSDISRPIQLSDDSANVAVYGIPYLEPGTSNHHLNALLGNNLEEEMSSATQDVADQRMDPSAVVLKEFSWSNPKKRLFEDYTREAIDPSTSVDRLRELASAGWPWLVSFHPSLPQRDQRSYKKRRPSEVELAAIAATSNPRVINFVVSKGSRSKSHRLAARAVAANPHITKRASVTLAKSSSLGLRLILANNPGIAPQARMILSGDEHIWIRSAIEDSSAAATDAKNFVDLFTFKSLNTDQ